jgi:hypothetical protein
LCITISRWMTDGREMLPVVQLPSGSLPTKPLRLSGYQGNGRRIRPVRIFSVVSRHHFSGSIRQRSQGRVGYGGILEFSVVRMKTVGTGETRWNGILACCIVG